MTVPSHPLATAEMISPSDPAAQAAHLQTTVTLDTGHGAVREATLAATAHGIYEATVNGSAVDASVFNPGWTSYEWRLQVQTVDVTGLVTTGDNVVDLHLGNGWWRGKLGFQGGDDYGPEIGVAAALTVRFEDGHTQTVETGADWTCTRSQVTENTIYDGVALDLRIEPGEPQPVRVTEYDRDTLVAQHAPLVTRHETIAPQRIWTSPSGRTLIDFGQNLVGWIRLHTPADEGRTITLRHAEVLEHDELGVRPLRSAKATDTIVCSGDRATVEPTFTFHGFRYAEIEGWDGEPTADDLEAVVVHSDLRRTGHFRCSDERVNQLHRNVVWGQKGNFLDVPTDCPQRNERLGWTGDIAAFTPAAAYLFDVSDFLHKWLLDLRAETAAAGRVPFVVPDILKLSAQHRSGEVGPTTVWGDAAAWVPEALWHAYGDRDRLAEHYPGMVLHLEGVEGVLSETGLWDEGFQFADWLDPDAPPDAPGDAKADKGVVATASGHRSFLFGAEAARILGHTEDAERWAATARRMREAFNEHYVDDAGIIHSDCATVYALAICFDLLDADREAKAGDRLAELVRANDHKISTGFAGTPFVTFALTRTGHVDDAYGLLLQTENPSWLYPVTMGATTIWERWDSMLPDGTINPGEMTSFNHYAFGAVADWLHQEVAGIRPAEPGYAAVLIKPIPGPGLTSAEASLESPHGTISSAWSTEGGGFRLDVEIPDGVPAVVELPDGARHEVTGGRHTFGG